MGNAIAYLGYGFNIGEDLPPEVEQAVEDDFHLMLFCTGHENGAEYWSVVLAKTFASVDYEAFHIPNPQHPFYNDYEHLEKFCKLHNLQTDRFGWLLGAYYG